MPRHRLNTFTISSKSGFSQFAFWGDRTQAASKDDNLMTKELIAVQYLRGIAVIVVILHHLFSTGGLEYLFRPHLGEFGVEIFFVVSGFIMWHTTVAVDISPAEFWRRRTIRIVPLYWIFLSVMVIFVLAAPRAFNSTVITPENTIKSFLFIPHFHVVQHFIAPILIPGWSLNYEMFFYFIFGFTLLVSSRPRRAILLGAILLGLVLLGLFLQPTGAVATTYTGSGLLNFLDGIILAILFRSGRLNGAIFGLALISVGLLCRTISISNEFSMLDSFVGISPTLIVAGALALELAARRAPNLLFHAIGNASYSTYLSHLFFLRLLELAWRHFSSFGYSNALDAAYVTLGLSFAIAGGIAVYFFIERPILFLLHRRYTPRLPKAA